MHELSLTTDMIQTVSEKMSTMPEKKVKKVVLEIGKLTAVLPDAMKFCFEIVVRETDLEGAALEVIQTEGRELRIKHLEVV